MTSISFVDPFVAVALPFNEFFFLEPEGDLFVGILNSVRSVDDVSSGVNAEVSSDGSRG